MARRRQTRSKTTTENLEASSLDAPQSPTELRFRLAGMPSSDDAAAQARATYMGVDLKKAKDYTTEEKARIREQIAHETRLEFLTSRQPEEEYPKHLFSGRLVKSFYEDEGRSDDEYPKELFPQQEVESVYEDEELPWERTVRLNREALEAARAKRRGYRVSATRGRRGGAARAAAGRNVGRGQAANALNTAANNMGQSQRGQRPRAPSRKGRENNTSSVSASSQTSRTTSETPDPSNSATDPENAGAKRKRLQSDQGVEEAAPRKKGVLAATNDRSAGNEDQPARRDSQTADAIEEMKESKSTSSAAKQSRKRNFKSAKFVVEEDSSESLASQLETQANGVSMERTKPSKPKSTTKGMDKETAQGDDEVNAPAQKSRIVVLTFPNGLPPAALAMGSKPDKDEEAALTTSEPAAAHSKRSVKRTPAQNTEPKSKTASKKVAVKKSTVRKQNTSEDDDEIDDEPEPTPTETRPPVKLKLKLSSSKKNTEAGGTQENEEVAAETAQEKTTKKKRKSVRKASTPASASSETSLAAQMAESNADEEMADAVA